MLVYLASFERTAEVVLDVGIDAKALGEALSKPHPSTDDDVDELSNEVAA